MASPARSSAGPNPFRSCAAARAAGAAPLSRGDPGYNPNLDGDGDGLACEPYRRR
ncbi:excalibur calcium-binding domain-containing protein [Phenylobacterium sp.]|uniref:excalibur calcium-binding domain-containing protein n=1 Tax=Phenylobacterium sp. TaxID=1871053 RepID=UPI003FA712EA